jgi:hypothetical protein
MPWQKGSGSRTRAAFVVLVGPGRSIQKGLGLMLKSLHINVLAAHPRPVLLFFADDVPPEQSTPDALDEACPAAIRHLIEVRVTAAHREPVRSGAWPITMRSATTQSYCMAHAVPW